MLMAIVWLGSSPTLRLYHGSSSPFWRFICLFQSSWPLPQSHKMLFSFINRFNNRASTSKASRLLHFKDSIIQITMLHISLLRFLSSISLGECLSLDSIIEFLSLGKVCFSNVMTLCKILQMENNLSSQWPASSLLAGRGRWLQPLPWNSNSPLNPLKMSF